MKRLLKNSRILLASLGVVAFLMVAGWQFGIGDSEAAFSETKVALENSFGGSGTFKDLEVGRRPDGSQCFRCVDHEWRGCEEPLNAC